MKLARLVSLFTPFGGGGGAPVDPGPATIREAFYHRLSTTAAVAAIVGARIHPGGLPQKGAAFPAVSYLFDSRTFGRNLDGADGTSVASVRLDAWSFSQPECDRLAEAIRNRFDGFRGAIGQVVVTAAWVDDLVDLPEPPDKADGRWLFRVSAPLTIQHRLARPDQLQE